MITNQIQPEITIDIVRCYKCGRFWGTERAIPGTCPHCAEEKISAAAKRVSDMERSIRSLRGVITRKKKQ